MFINSKTILLQLYSFLSIVNGQSLEDDESLDSRKICPYGFVGSTCQIECGVTFKDQNEKVVGGSVAVASSWPAQILLEICYCFGSCSCSNLCGGTLVDDKTVITAAHCILSNEAIYNVYLGVQNIKKLEKEGVKILVSKVIKHKSFDIDGTFQNDIAILKLAKSAPINKKIQVACLPRAKSISFPANNRDSWIVGWGTISEDSSSLNNLLKNAKITVYNPKMCIQVSRNTVKNWNTQICAGEYNGGIDTCKGDSGGPLYVLSKINNKEKYILSGITSYGTGCARQYSPGIYTRVSAYLDFINKNME